MGGARHPRTLPERGSDGWTSPLSAGRRPAAIGHLLGLPGIRALHQLRAVSVGKDNNHVLLLLGYQQGDPGKVLLYDTAIEDGGIKTPGIQAFVDAANQMFLMDLYTPRSQSS